MSRFIVRPPVFAALIVGSLLGEGFDEGDRSIPANWGLGSPRKAGFFRLLDEIAGANPTAK